MPERTLRESLAAFAGTGPANERDQYAERERGPVGTDRRAVVPVVGKSLEVGLVVLFVGLVTAVLLGGVVPDYQRAVDARVGDRVLAAASGEIERAVPPAAGAVDVEARYRADLPTHVGDSGYTLRVDGRELVLDHPDPAVSGRVRLVLPDRVDRVEGSWQSGARTVVAVNGDADGLVVELTEGGGE